MLNFKQFLTEDVRLIRRKSNERLLMPGINWYDIHHQGKKIGDVTVLHKEGTTNAWPSIKPEHQKKGHGVRIYQKIQKLAKKNNCNLEPSTCLTTAGYNLWSKIDKSKIANHKYDKNTTTWNKD